MEKTITIKKGKEIGGIPARAVTIPALIITLLIAISIFVIITMANKAGDETIAYMNEANTYRLDALDMISGVSVCSETCNNYIQTPENTTTHQSNYGPLLTYIPELSSDRTPEKTLQRFRTYGVSSDSLLLVADAVDKAKEMRRVQIHAISVMNSVYPLTNCPVPIQTQLQPLLDVLIDLTPEEEAMDTAARAAYAESLINAYDYAQLRAGVSRDIDQCNVTIRTNFNKKIEAKSNFVKTLRNVLAVEAITLVLVMITLFVLFYFYMVKPLRNYAKDIASNRSIEKQSKVREIRRVVKSYNQLWNYRNKLEEVLRTEAENDALTGLPNRYSMERDWLKHQDCDDPIAILVFDLNYLKQINDTKGHTAGDQAIHAAALCVKECFGIDGLENCYRIGGDEFLAVVQGFDEGNIKKRVDRFRLATVRDGISVAVGYSFSKTTESEKFKHMVDEADTRMYEDKKRAHALRDKEESEKSAKEQEKSDSNENNSTDNKESN